MELRDFAERILLGTTLADKLTPPPHVVDDHPGPALIGDPLPGRPPGLAFKPLNAERARFPRAKALENERDRGRALHFFANHELLALELMALALLRFPNAPRSFRKRILATMRDEQRHMQLYLDRMHQLGVELGEIPLNSFFWDLLSDMHQPIDFIARMSLTFEQANLDFSLHFRDAFRHIGDQSSADIMDVVLEDEVSHVRHGVLFFEKWRDPELSQWEAYQSLLEFPLTPARAKGIGFTRKHRVQAGLEPDFIDRLRVFSHSKGRPPRVAVFNPDTEMALARDARGHTPPAAVTAMERDLETLPLFLVNPPDVVLVRDAPQPDHLRVLMDAGCRLPEFIPTDLSSGALKSTHPLHARTLEGFLPWGWDPSIGELLAPLEGRLRHGGRPLPERLSTQREVASKAWLAELLPDLLQSLPPEIREQVHGTDLPRNCGNLAEVQSTLTDWSKAGHGFVVVKAPLGSAGRAALRVAEGTPTHAQTRWMEEVLNQQGKVVIEPWHIRIADYSHLFEIRPGASPIEHGTTRFLTDAGGRYKGTLVGPMKMGLAPDIQDFVHRACGNPDWIRETCRLVRAYLSERMIALGFEGLAGFDLMVIRNQEGALKLRIPLELNPRPTMGHIALAIGRQVAPAQHGLWSLWTRKELHRSGIPEIPALLPHLRAQHSADDTTLLATNDPNTASQVLSLWTSASSLDTVRQLYMEAGLGDPVRVQTLHRTD